MIRGFDIRHSRGVKSLAPYAAGILDAILADQFIHEGKRARQSKWLMERENALPDFQCGFGLLSGREEIQGLKIRVHISGENFVQKAINIMVGPPDSRN